ncbi:MAG: PQQ-dependent sugar dehydrogenase [Actinobacteria bacterium]|nr:PQQ-dependent sugar dehydrogenase [Actinomycetota bacterium]
MRPVVDGLTQPLLVTGAGDGSGRLFVVEQGGNIRVFAGGRLAPEPFLDISDLTEPGGEQGLLGLAFHPRFDANGRFFVNYTDTAGDTVVAEYRADPGAGVADPGSATTLLQIDQPFPNHNGGHLAFGPDGYLYVATGDGGSGGDPFNNGQSLDTLLGKLLRIDVDAAGGGLAYGIPPDNPFIDRDGARPEIWASGLRNPWRFSFDREAGDLWIGDVGQEELEEVNRVPAAKAGLDFGWDDLEGSDCYEPASGCDRNGVVLPVAQYTHDEGCSVTGGFVYRGSQYPELGGGYFFADYCSGSVYGIVAGSAGLTDPAPLLQSESSVSSWGEDDEGELYLVDIAGGRVLQLTAET